MKLDLHGSCLSLTTIFKLLDQTHELSWCISARAGARIHGARASARAAFELGGLSRLVAMARRSEVAYTARAAQAAGACNASQSDPPPLVAGFPDLAAAASTAP
jgi:hypothetical protein